MISFQKPVFALICAFAGSPITVVAQELGDGSISDEIIVFGRGQNLIGSAQAASEGEVSGSDLLVRPLLRVAELLEATPGMVAAQHSGSGKANQYFLRGFNLDHGSDFSAYVDNVQMNLRTHGHGHGYLDLNGLIPEIVDGLSYRKGPYRTTDGDFALAGAAYIDTIDSYDHNWATAEIGSYGWRRFAAGGTLGEIGNGDLTLVAEAKLFDGPWEKPERLRHFAAFSKYVLPVSFGDLEMSGHAYRATWRPTEQIPERIVGSPLCADVFCSPDPTATGETTRVVLNTALQGDSWSANVFTQFYDWTMFSNPTYANPDGSSAQIEQFDKRWVVGAQIDKSWSVAPQFDIATGLDGRYDHIGRVGVFQTDQRVFVESVGVSAVDETSLAIYAETTWNPFKRLRLTGGVRGDYHSFGVYAKDSAAEALGEGGGHDSIFSPKVSAAFVVTDEIELYANWGKGFHSNDVRGTVSFDTPVPPLVRGVGKEVGVRYQGGGISLTATYWMLDLDSELRFVGDSNSVEPSGASNRHGFEFVAFWRPLAWFAVDGNFTISKSRYDNGDYIPNAFKNAGQVGVSAILDGWEGSIRYRHLGSYPLIEDNSLRDGGSNIVNARGAWKQGNIEIYAEVLNILSSDDKDIAYYYESYIPAYDPVPIEGRLSRVIEPRSFRIGLKYRV